MVNHMIHSFRRSVVEPPPVWREKGDRRLQFEHRVKWIALWVICTKMRRCLRSSLTQLLARGGWRAVDSLFWGKRSERHRRALGATAVLILQHLSPILNETAQAAAVWSTSACVEKSLSDRAAASRAICDQRPPTPEPVPSLDPARQQRCDSSLCLRWSAGWAFQFAFQDHVLTMWRMMFQHAAT